MSFYRAKRWSHAVAAPMGAWNVSHSAPDPALVAAAAARIAAIEADSGYSSLTERDRDFIVSVKGQVANNRVPSDAQASWLARIEKRLVPVDNSYFDASNAEHVAKRAYAIMHYKATGYYSQVVAAMEADAAYIPHVETWERMWANKFINCGFKRYSAGAKYAAGDMVKVKIYSAKHDGIIVSAKWSAGTVNNWVYETLILSGTYQPTYAARGINPDIKETDISIDRAAASAAKKAEKEAEKAAKAAEKARLKAEKDAAKALAALNKPVRKARAKKSA